MDLVSHFESETRRAERFKVVPYEIPAGCAAAYFPETNVLVPVDSVSDGSNQPASKSVIVTIDSRYNKILCRPSIVSRGFVFIKENQTLLKEAEMVVYEALKKTMQNKTTFGELKNAIRGSLEPLLYQKTRRNPIVVPVILNQKAAMVGYAKTK